MRIGQESRLFNAEIRSRREALGLTQGELGDKIGHSNGAKISQAESLRTTNPKAPVIVALASFFDVSPEVLCPAWLVMLDGIPKKQIRTAKLTKNLLAQTVAKQLLAIDMNGSFMPVDVDQDLLVEAVKESVPKLSPVEQQVLNLSFGLSGHDQKTPREIAKIVKLKGVSAILNRATKKLRKNEKIAERLKYFYDSATRRTRRLSDTLGEPDNKTSFYLPESGQAEEVSDDQTRDS